MTFAPLPFGTGNDISRTLGWGGKEGKLADDLEYMISSLINNERDNFALWEVEVQASEALGYRNGEKVKISIDGEFFKKMMCCHFNLGLDSIISNSKLFSKYLIIFSA